MSTKAERQLAKEIKEIIQSHFPESKLKFVELTHQYWMGKKECKSVTTLIGDFHQHFKRDEVVNQVMWKNKYLNRANFKWNPFKTVFDIVEMHKNKNKERGFSGNLEVNPFVLFHNIFKITVGEYQDNLMPIDVLTCMNAYTEANEQKLHDEFFAKSNNEDDFNRIMFSLRRNYKFLTDKLSEDVKKSKSKELPKFKITYPEEKDYILRDWAIANNRATTKGTIVHEMLEYLMKEFAEGVQQISKLELWINKNLKTYTEKIENLLCDTLRRNPDYAFSNNDVYPGEMDKDVTRVVKEIKKEIKETSRHMAELVLKINKMGLVSVASEIRVFSEKFAVAGTIDELFYSPKTNQLIVADWKTNKLIALENSFSSMSKDLNHLQDTNYVHYSTQLDIYRMLMTSNEDLMRQLREKLGQDFSIADTGLLFHVTRDGINMYNTKSNPGKEERFLTNDGKSIGEAVLNSRLVEETVPQNNLKLIEKITTEIDKNVLIEQNKEINQFNNPEEEYSHVNN